MKRLLQLGAGLFALAVLVLVGGIALSWAPDLTVAELAPRWAPPPSQFIAIDGMLIHLRDEGPREDPAPLVFLHGTSASLHTWQAWTETLRATRRVIRLDLPGFGLTGPFVDADYTMAHYVRVLGQLLDTLQLSRLVLVGNSFGGNVAWHAAFAMPERIQALILIDAAGYAHEPRSVPVGFRLARMRWLAPLLTRVLPRRTVESSVRNVYGDPSRVTPQLVERYRQLTLRAGNRAALGERFRQVVPGADGAQIKSLRLPTLILWGERDQLIPLASGEQFRRDIPGSELVVLPGLGHVPHEEGPVASLAPALAFLQRHPADAAAP